MNISQKEDEKSSSKQKLTHITYNKQTLSEISFDERLAANLGYEKTRYAFLSNTSSIISKSQAVLIPMDELFVYTDIIEHQYKGDAKAKVLRVIGVDHNTRETRKLISRIFDTPHYVPLKRTNIELYQIFLIN